MYTKPINWTVEKDGYKFLSLFNQYVMRSSKMSLMNSITKLKSSLKFNCIELYFVVNPVKIDLAVSEI